MALLFIKGLKNKFETDMENELSVFEPLKPLYFHPTLFISPSVIADYLKLIYCCFVCRGLVNISVLQWYSYVFKYWDILSLKTLFFSLGQREKY